MSMSLTISQPAKSEFGSSRFTHDFNPRISLAKSRFTPPSKVSSPPPVSSLRVSATPADDKMSTHRGLPPPSAMTLPDPRHPLVQPLGAMPAPPNQWQGQEESMRNWLVAKAEEDKRKQEEERTRQETLKLEQRKIEQSMLRESLQGGVPPQMVPMIYAGIGGANLSNFSVDWLHQYVGQLQAAQQQIPHQQSLETRREPGRLIAPPAHTYPPNPAMMQPVLSSQQTEPFSGPQGAAHITFPTYPPGAARQPQQNPAPRSTPHTQLPKLTTNEMYIHNPPQPGAGDVHSLPPGQPMQQQDASSSPSIYFHHWVPPTESKGAAQPQTPASKGEPQSAHPASTLRESEYRESPRKRKAQGGHEANPPPSSGGPAYTSPPFSTTSSTSGRKGGHVRSRSNASMGLESDSRPDSRDPPSSAPRQPDSGTTNISTVSTGTDDSAQQATSQTHEEAPRSLTEAFPREKHPEHSGPESR